MDSNNRPVVPLAFPLRTPPAPPRASEPSIAENFEALIESEIGPIPALGLTTELFVERVNATHALRYYFQEPFENELWALGIGRQGYWLRVRPGSEHFLVSVPRIAAVLKAARVRALNR